MQPTVVSRSGWGAAPASGKTRWKSGQPTGTTGHWEGAGGSSDHGHCADEVRAIQRYEQEQKGYVDIAYNWLICVHGVVFEGREVDQFQSAAQNDGNPKHVAICFMWGPSFHLSDASKAAFNWLLEQRDPIGARGWVGGHRDDPSNNTSCPGDECEAWIKAGRPGGSVASPHPAPAQPKPLPPEGFHHPVIQHGSLGIAVTELQRKLDAVTGAGLVTDGQFGPKTQNAVIAFQHFFKLVPDGIVGPATWGMLDYCCALKGIH